MTVRPSSSPRFAGKTVIVGAGSEQKAQISSALQGQHISFKKIEFIPKSGTGEKPSTSYLTGQDLRNFNQVWDIMEPTIPDVAKLPSDQDRLVDQVLRGLDCWRRLGALVINVQDQRIPLTGEQLSQMITELRKNP